MLKYIYISSIILYSSSFVVMIPLVLSWLLYRKNTIVYRVLTWHLSFAAISSSIALLMMDMDVNNLPFLHIYTILEFAFITVFFYFLQIGVLRKTVLIVMIICFTLLGLSNAIFFQGWYRFNTLPRSVESLTVIILCITCYYRMLLELKTNKIYKDPVFWINTGFLIYFSGALFLFMMSNYILPLNIKLNMLVWSIHAIFSDLLYLFIFIGLCNIRKT